MNGVFDPLNPNHYMRRWREVLPVPEGDNGVRLESEWHIWATGYPVVVESDEGSIFTYLPMTPCAWRSHFNGFCLGVMESVAPQMADAPREWRREFVEYVRNELYVEPWREGYDDPVPGNAMLFPLWIEWIYSSEERLQHWKRWSAVFMDLGGVDVRTEGLS